MRMLISLLFLLSAFTYGQVPPSASEVFFIPTLHRLHKDHPKYSYEDLKAYLEELSPDVIAVEIRPEDLDRDSLYLAKNYPLEMRLAHYWVPKAKREGVDWLGEELEGKPVSDDYWPNSKIKKMQAELAKDSIFREKLKACYLRKPERDQLLKSATLDELKLFHQQEVVRDQYACFAKIAQGSPYQFLSDFYTERDQRILSNIRRIIAKYPGKRIAILVGDDHYGVLHKRFAHR